MKILKNKIFIVFVLVFIYFLFNGSDVFAEFLFTLNDGHVLCQEETFPRDVEYVNIVVRGYFESSSTFRGKIYFLTTQASYSQLSDGRPIIEWGESDYVGFCCDTEADLDVSFLQYGFDLNGSVCGQTDISTDTNYIEISGYSYGIYNVSCVDGKLSQSGFLYDDLLSEADVEPIVGLNGRVLGVDSISFSFLDEFDVTITNPVILNFKNIFIYTIPSYKTTSSISGTFVVPPSIRIFLSNDYAFAFTYNYPTRMYGFVTRDIEFVSSPGITAGYYLLETPVGAWSGIPRRYATGY